MEEMGGRQEGGRDRPAAKPGAAEGKLCFGHTLCHYFLEGQACGDSYMKPFFLLYSSPAIPNKLYFNLKQQFTVQFIYNNTIHCDHNAINLCFK